MKILKKLLVVIHSSSVWVLNVDIAKKIGRGSQNIYVSLFRYNSEAFTSDSYKKHDEWSFPLMS